MNRPGPHDGHRQRLKNRFLNSSLEGFEPHQILELLLFYSIPRQDTNEIAHALLDKFGSLSAVFNASFEDLITVSGIKENSATLIKLIPQIMKVYLLDKTKGKNILDTIPKVGAHLIATFIGETHEAVYAILLNDIFEHLGTVKICDGTFASASFSVRKIIDPAVKAGASMVVIAHNHPHGSVTPSAEDLDATYSLVSMLSSLDIGVLDHFIVANNEYNSLFETVLSKLKNESLPQFRSH